MKAKHIKNLDTKLRLAKTFFWLLYSAFIALVLYVNILRETYTLIALQCLPLLILLPGMLQGHYRSFSWFCFMLLLYFIWGVEGVFRSDAGWIQWAYLMLICALYIGAILCGRYSQRKLKGNPPVTTNEAPSSSS